LALFWWGGFLISFYHIGRTIVDNSVEGVEKSPLLRVFAEKTPYGLGIFAKEPVPGRVKTRLSPPLKAEEAADLYRISLEETVAFASCGPWQTVLFYAGDRKFFSEVFPQIHLHPQRGSDLGESMANALTMLLCVCERAVLIGSDTPDLPLHHLHDAFAALGDHDAVLAPARDGGYVLIGERTHHPELFRDIPWSTPEVLPLTRARAQENAISLAETGLWEDLDDAVSLLRLLERSPLSRTAQFAREKLSTSYGTVLP
jgi:uncharacterized protein